MLIVYVINISILDIKEKR